MPAETKRKSQAGGFAADSAEQSQVIELLFRTSGRAGRLSFTLRETTLLMKLHIEELPVVSSH